MKLINHKLLMMPNHINTMPIDQNFSIPKQKKAPSLKSIVNSKIQILKSQWDAIFHIDLNFELDDDINEQIMNDLWK